jgi:hypothetical protein
MSRRPDCQAAELLYDCRLMLKKPLGIEIVVLVKKIYELLQILAGEDLGESSAVGLLNIDRRVTAVKVAQDKISSGRDNQGFSQVPRISQTNKRFSLLLDRKSFNGSKARIFIHPTKMRAGRTGVKGLTGGS